MSKKDKRESFKITPFHVNNSVTGSSVLVEVDGLKILLDLGMFQSQTHKIEDVYKINYSKLRIPFSELDYIILSSCHCDHSCGTGLIGREDIEFNGKVIATEMSAELIALNIRDSAHLMFKECEAYNEKNKNKEPLRPLYSMEEAEEAISQIRGYGLEQKIYLNDNVYFEYIPNGHLSGDGSIYITYQKNQYEDEHLLYTGDHNYGRKKPFTKSWNKNNLKVDYLITESTYSGKEHDKTDNFKLLKDSVLDCCVNRKKILFIPCFSIHRQQEVLYMLNKIFKETKVLQDSNIPIYSAGVMSAKAHRILGNPKFKNFYDEEWQDLYDVFNWNRIIHLESFKDVIDKTLDNKVKIVLASSGMLTGGYSSYLTACYVGRRDRQQVNFLFCGYQAIGSVGDNILNSNHKTVSIQGKSYIKNCNILGKLDLSGHADDKHLRALIKSCNQNILKKVIIIHGDLDRKELLKEELESELNKNIEVIIPKFGNKV